LGHALAAGVTFYILLTIFPAIAALFAIYGLFADHVSNAPARDIDSEQGYLFSDHPPLAI
jgi:membrane protein